jgi:hypothetical protein
MYHYFRLAFEFSAFFFISGVELWKTKGVRDQILTQHCSVAEEAFSFLTLWAVVLELHRTSFSNTKNLWRPPVKPFCKYVPKSRSFQFS